MIKKIKLENFRHFENLDLTLKGLNVFMVRRINEKSDVIRTILLVSQSIESYERYRNLCPGFFMPRCPYLLLCGGKYTSLGLYDDVLHDPSKETFDFFLQGDRGELKLHMSRCSNCEAVASVRDFPVTNEPMQDIGFEYLFDFRVAPGFCWSHDSPIARDELARRQLGKAGEYTARYLSSHRLDKVESMDVRIPEYVSSRLEEMFPGGMRCVSDILSHDPRLPNTWPRGGRELSETIWTGDTVLSCYGLQYTLPVLVALAKARRGDILIVENPEAYVYLDGRQQRKLCEFIVETSERGVQIFLETRSVEMIQGIRDIARRGGAMRSNIDYAIFYEDDGFVKKLEEFHGTRN